MSAAKGGNFKFVAVDPGYDRCGFMVGKLCKARLSILDYGYITTTPDEGLADRLLELGNDFDLLLKRYRPDYLFIEKIFFTVNKKTGINIAKVIGLLEFLARRRGLAVLEISPNHIKKVVTGNGQARKEQVEYMIKQLFKQSFEFYIDDVADAFAIAYTGMVELTKT